MAKRPSIYRVTRYLEQQLRVLPTGEALPSTRQVMSVCRVGPQTVAAAVRQLEQRRVVEVRPQHGSFKTGVPPRVDRLDVLYFNISGNGSPDVMDATLSPFHAELLRYLAEHGRQCAIQPRIHKTYLGHPQADVVERVAHDPDAQACLTVNLSETSLLEPLAAAHLPYVNLYPVGFHVPDNALVTDADDVVSTQLDYLVGLGHRRIALLHAVKDHRPLALHLMRREAFYRLSLERELPLKPPYVQYAGYRAPDIRAATARLLALRPRPTAVICADLHLPHVYAVAQAEGLEVGRSLSVLGTDDLPATERLDPPATSTRVPRQTAVVAAYQLLERVLAGEHLTPQAAIPLTARVIERGSTGPAPRRA